MMSSERFLQLPNYDFSDTQALLQWITQSGCDRSSAVDLFLKGLKQYGQTLPCTAIRFVDQLESCLSGRDGHGVGFIVFHPPSGIRSSNGDSVFVSLAHQNGNSALIADDPWSRDPYRPTFSFFSFIKRKQAAVLELMTKVDAAYTFLDRSGVETEQHAGTLLFSQNREAYALCVFIPLKRDDNSFEAGWVVYGVTNG